MTTPQAALDAAKMATPPLAVLAVASWSEWPILVGTAVTAATAIVTGVLVAWVKVAKTRNEIAIDRAAAEAEQERISEDARIKRERDAEAARLEMLRLADAANKESLSKQLEAAIAATAEATRKAAEQAAEFARRSEDNQQHMRDSLHEIRDKAEAERSENQNLRLDLKELREQLRQTEGALEIATTGLREALNKMADFERKWTAAEYEKAQLRREVEAMKARLSDLEKPGPMNDVTTRLDNLESAQTTPA